MRRHVLVALAWVAACGGGDGDGAADARPPPVSIVGDFTGTLGEGPRGLSFTIDAERRLLDVALTVTGGACGDGSAIELTFAGPAALGQGDRFSLTTVVELDGRAGCGPDGACATVVLEGQVTGDQAAGTADLFFFTLGGPLCAGQLRDPWHAEQGCGARPAAGASATRFCGEPPVEPDAGAPPSPEPLAGLVVGGGPSEEALRVRPTGDGGLVVAGHRFTGADPRTADGYGLKLDAAGALLWTRTAMRRGLDGFSDVLVLDDGYLFAGHASPEGGGARAPYLMRTDAAGNVLWDNAYPSARASWLQTVHRGPAGGFIGFGTRHGAQGADDSQILIFTVDETGGAPSGRELGVAGGRDATIDAIATADGGFALTGTSPPEVGTGQDAFLVKLDGALELQWVARFGGSGDDVGNAVVELAGGGFVVAGGARGAPGDERALLARIDATGRVAWRRSFGDPELAPIVRAHGVAEGEGGLVVCGAAHHPSGADLYLARVDLEGALLGERLLGGAGHDGCWQLARAGDDLVVAGSTTSAGAGGFDILVVRASLSGAPR